MKLLILLCFLFAYTKAGCDDECEYTDVGEAGCYGNDESVQFDCTPCVCVVDDNDDCTAACDDPAPTVIPEPDCDDDLDESKWTVQYIGKSTQWRLLDPCDKRKITFKMEDLTEYEEGGKKTVNKETSFASSKNWEWDNENPEDNINADGDKISTRFVADQLTNPAASFTLQTDFFRVSQEITDPDNSSLTIWVDKNSFKFSTNITGWPTTDGNYLELCVTIKTNSGGFFTGGDDEAVCDPQYCIDSPTDMTCDDEPVTNGVEVTTGSNGGKNQLSLCYKFASCDGTIYYDPLVKILQNGGNAISVFVVCVVSIVSVFFV